MVKRYRIMLKQNLEPGNRRLVSAALFDGEAFFDSAALLGVGRPAPYHSHPSIRPKVPSLRWVTSYSCSLLGHREYCTLAVFDRCEARKSPGTGSANGLLSD